METARNSQVLQTIPLLIILFVISPDTVQSQDGRPIADAGLLRYAGPDPIVLDGTRSYDPDNSGSLSYEWRQVSGLPVIIVDANTATPTIAGSMLPGSGRNPTLKPGGFPQSDEIQECEFELVVNDGELASLSDSVKVIIVPDFGETTPRLVNEFFDPAKPTCVWFWGGDGIFGVPVQFAWSDATSLEWLSKANNIEFSKGYQPDPGYTPDDVDAPRTYYRCGDMIIVFLSSVAADYKMPIQTMGFSTGGQPAIDVGIYLNMTYADARYAINRVTLLDARAGRDYSEYIPQFLDSAVDGEQCWIDNHRGGTDGPFPSWPSFYPNVLRVGSSLSHIGVPTWYTRSLANVDMNQFNHGVVGGAYWSVVGPGKNLQLASTPGVETYSFKWVGSESTGYMDFWDEPNHPGRLPESVTLVGPEEGAIVNANGAVFSCEVSENAVGYQLLFGSDPYRVMDYIVVSDTPSPPVEVISEFAFEKTWWTVRAYDSFGSTIYADPRCINAIFPAYAKYSGGTGEPNDPYLIYTAEHLNELGAEPNDYDKHFKLMADIDLSGYLYDRAVIAPDTDDTEHSFQGTPFEGVFDGDGHTISNLTITGESYLGLFGQLGFGARISNLGLEAVDVNGIGDYIGGLVGWNYGSITLSYSSGTVTGYWAVGGLVGENDWIGAAIIASYSSGTVSGDQRVGGLVGYNNGARIGTSYSTGTVTGRGYVGGLVGHSDFSVDLSIRRGRINTSYSTGTVSGKDHVGGLVGYNSWSCIITNCYSVSSVVGTMSVGGLVGSSEGTVDCCFWDTQTSGQLISAGGLGKTTAEMQTARTFLEAGWDLINVWGIGESQTYPYLRKYPAADINRDETVDFGDLAILAENWLADTTP